jgi:hypothetical protein
MEAQARKSTSLATLSPIMGLLIAGIVGVIAVPEVTLLAKPKDLLMVSSFSLLLVSTIFGGSNFIASRLLVKASAFISPTTGQPLQQVSGVKTFVFVMHIVWLAINGLFWLILSSIYNASYELDYYMEGNPRDGAPDSTLNPLTVIPLVFIAASLVGLHLLIMDMRARTATAPRPMWQMPPAPQPPVAPQS